MRNMRFVIGTSLFVLFFTSLPVRAGYLMDCSKASTKIEKQICADRELWHLDGLLNRHYTSAKARGGDLEELRRGQRRWLREVRDRCISDQCLRKVYKARLDFLERWEFFDPYCGEHTYPPYPDVWGFDAGRFGASSGTL